jgi:hypothetical protein
MKTTSIALLLMLSSFFTLKAQNENHKPAQISWGLKAEANYSGFLVSGTSIIESKVKPGGTFGGFFHVELSEYFALQGELQFHYKSSRMDRDGMKGDFRYWGMEIPAYIMYQKKFRNKTRLYTGVGPNAEFGFAAKLKRGTEKINPYEKDKSTDISAMKDSGAGFGFILGYEFVNGIQINTGYKISVTNILDANSSSFTLRPHSFNIGIGYHFH